MRVFYFLKQFGIFTHKLKFSVFDSLVIGSLIIVGDETLKNEFLLRLFLCHLIRGPPSFKFEKIERRIVWINIKEEDIRTILII